jgi:hypothetical protein
VVSRKVPTSLNLAKVFTMTTPRIYTYKITFEEVPYWYWGVHKERKFGELYLGSPKTHKWMWEFYTPKIQILEFFPYTDEGWEEANRVEKRLIKNDLNNPLCLNENCGGCISLSCRREGGNKTHEEKDENGKSLHAVRLNEKIHKEKDENGKSLHAVKAANKTHEEKDKNGKSLHAVKMGKKGAEKTHEAKDKDGKSLQGLKNSDRLNKEKDENGKSLQGIENAKTLNAQIWESTMDSFRGNAGNVAKHNRANGWDPNARIRIS